MSLYGVMRTGVSGMNAQATRLSTVAENVANVNTTGYKRASCEFSSLLLSTCPGGYEPGSVLPHIRNHVAAQGSLRDTASSTDLAIIGNGFFVVAGPGGAPVLTRAGSFVPSANGNLLNAAGFALMGYRLEPGLPGVTVNGFSGLTPVNLEALTLTASASTLGTMVANLPSAAAVVDAAVLPGLNLPDSSFTAKSSLMTYDGLGNEVKIDLYFAKTGINEWQVAAFDAADSSTGGFPYGSAALAVASLSFDAASGRLTSASDSSLAFPIPGGAPFTLDLAGTTQLATDYVVLSAQVNGNAPSGAEFVDIESDGSVIATYGNGTRLPVYRIPLAHVQSPDMLTPEAGNVFRVSTDSGDVRIGFPETGGLGSIRSGALEQSTVDLADELTSMIDAQRSYTANSKVFQTGSELMEVLVNLKR